jgi:hypothetical protein
MSVLTLPEPVNWPASGRRLGRLTLLLAGFFAVGIFVGTLSLLRGAYLETVVGVGFLLPLILALVAVQLVARGHAALCAGHDSTGTMLRPDRTFSALGLSAFAVVIPIGIIFVIFTLTGDLHMFPSKRGQAGAVVLACLATGTAIWALITAWRRGGIGYVKLTPSGIDIADIKSTESVSWNDVVAVDDHSETNKKTRKAIVLRFQDGTEKTIDGADFYVPNGAALYWMVRQYWRHADDRPELTDGRALERLRDGRFDLA